MGSYEAFKKLFEEEIDTSELNQYLIRDYLQSLEERNPDLCALVVSIPDVYYLDRLDGLAEWYQVISGSSAFYLFHSGGIEALSKREGFLKFRELLKKKEV